MADGPYAAKAALVGTLHVGGVDLPLAEPRPAGHCDAAGRRVLNKYFPADLDPSRRLPKSAGGGKKGRGDNAPSEVRYMLPFSIRCEGCGAFLGAGSKLNAKKTDARNDYLGVKRLRFSFKCSQCKNPISMLTDPRNAGYEMEKGATANDLHGHFLSRCRFTS